MKAETQKSYTQVPILFGLFLLILSPTLFSDGMFMDGLYYAVISRNMAEGVGTFWSPRFSETFNSVFNGHPPLQLGLQALLFYIFGDSIFVERFYSLFTGLVTLLLIRKIWVFETKSQTDAWLPAVSWLMLPLVAWAYSNNMLENTMTVFVLFAILFSLQSIERMRFMNISLAAISLIFAFLTKGFTGLFPFGVFFFVWLIKKEITFKRFVLDTALMFLIFGASVLLLFGISKSAGNYILNYIDIQVVDSIETAKTVGSRFAILGAFLGQIIPHFAVLAVIFIIRKIRRKSLQFSKETFKKFLFWFLIGLSGTLPMMISLKQRDFYLITTLPMYALAFAYIFKPYISEIRLSLKMKKITVFLGIFILAVSIGLSFYFSGKVGRDKVQISDIKTICEQVPEGEIISICPELRTNWSMYGYLQRYGKINAEVSDKNRILIGETPCYSSYTEILSGNFRYKIYEKNTNNPINP